MQMVHAQRAVPLTLVGALTPMSCAIAGVMPPDRQRKQKHDTPFTRGPPHVALKALTGERHTGNARISPQPIPQHPVQTSRQEQHPSVSQLAPVPTQRHPPMNDSSYSLAGVLRRLSAPQAGPFFGGC